MRPDDARWSPTTTAPERGEPAFPSVVTYRERGVLAPRASLAVMSAKKPPRPTFADIVAQVPETASSGEQFSYTIPRPWITVEGERWHLRGDASHEGKVVDKLL